MVVNSPDVSHAGRYSVRQAAKALGVCDNTIRNWIRAGVFRTSEYKRRSVGRKGVYIIGAGLIRVWNASY